MDRTRKTNSKGRTMTYTDKELEQAADIVVKAQEIQSNKELMKELEPVLKKKQETIGSLLSLKDLWKKGLEKAVQNETDGTTMPDDEKKEDDDD